MGAPGGGGGPFPPSMMRDDPQAARDDVIKGTDDDAIISSYLRTRSLDTFTEQFIKSGTVPSQTTTTTAAAATTHETGIKKQIVSLGCGSDTRYFKFKAKGLSAHKYFEIDFPESTAKKAVVIKKNKALPTLFLSECVLIYIQPGDSDAIVNWVGANMDASLFVVYEQINPTDAFGAMMLRNLK
ncbi:hypothetical protein BGZ95_011814, partial [Linnemannia exigua]